MTETVNKGKQNTVKWFVISIFAVCITLWGISAIQDVYLKQVAYEIQRDGIETVGEACSIRTTYVRRGPDNVYVGYCYEVEGKKYQVVNYLDEKLNKDAAMVEIKAKQKVEIYYLEEEPAKAAVGEKVTDD